MFKSKRNLWIIAISTLILILIGLQLLFKSPESLLKNAVVVLPQIDSRVFWIDSRRYIKVKDREPTPQHWESEWRLIDVVSGSERVVKPFSRAEPDDLFEPLSSPDGGWIINDCDRKFIPGMNRPEKFFFFSLLNGQLVKIPTNVKFIGWQKQSGNVLLSVTKGNFSVVRRASLPMLNLISDDPFAAGDFLNSRNSPRRFLATDDGNIEACEILKTSRINKVGEVEAKEDEIVSEITLSRSPLSSIQHTIKQSPLTTPDYPEYLSQAKLISPSPNGRRLLWRVDGNRLTTLQKFTRRFFLKFDDAPYRYVILYTTDIDGKNRHDLGELEIKSNLDHERVIYDESFTSNSSSIRFVSEGVTYDKLDR